MRKLSKYANFGILFDQFLVIFNTSEEIFCHIFSFFSTFFNPFFIWLFTPKISFEFFGCTYCVPLQLPITKCLCVWGLSTGNFLPTNKKVFDAKTPTGKCSFLRQRGYLFTIQLNLFNVLVRGLKIQVALTPDVFKSRF